jgi:hypothetical protein
MSSSFSYGYVEDIIHCNSIFFTNISYVCLLWFITGNKLNYGYNSANLRLPTSFTIAYCPNGLCFVSFNSIMQR